METIEGNGGRNLEINNLSSNQEMNFTLSFIHNRFLARATKPILVSSSLLVGYGSRAIIEVVSLTRAVGPRSPQLIRII